VKTASVHDSGLAESFSAPCSKTDPIRIRAAKKMIGRTSGEYASFLSLIIPRRLQLPAGVDAGPDVLIKGHPLVLHLLSCQITQPRETKKGKGVP
jgi:hypothetical protein